MRRLYSSFARGVPGLGLLLMRLVFGANLIFCGLMALRAGLGWHLALLEVIAIGAGLMLAVGLCTPMVGMLIALVALLQCVTLTQRPGGSILLGTVGIALAMIGPGIWSIDARLFGWQRLQIPPRPPDVPS